MTTDLLVDSRPRCRLFHGLLDQALIDMVPPHPAIPRVHRKTLGRKDIQTFNLGPSQNIQQSLGPLGAGKLLHFPDRLSDNAPPFPFKVGRLGPIRIMPGADFCLERFYQRREPPFNLAGKHGVAKLAFGRNCLLSVAPVSGSRRGRRYFPGRLVGQEPFKKNSQGMFCLPALPVGNTLALHQVSQEGLNIFARPVLQIFIRQETNKRLRPSYIKGRTIRTYPVLLRAGPESVPKFPLLFVVGEFHGTSHESTVISVN